MVMSSAVRSLAADIVCNAGSGHLGMPLGMADCLTVLFSEHLIFDAENPDWFNRDRFIMSGGHGSAALYALLYLCGYKNITIDELKNFRKLGSKTSGHPEYCVENGIEMTTGPLGEGISSAVGLALAERILNNRLGNECVNHYTYVCAGDGDLMEGVAHEACSLAGTLGLGRLIVLFDDNNITIDGNVDIVSKEDIKLRFKAYGWHVVEIDGHSHDAISAALSEAKAHLDTPSLICCKTKIGYGSCFENTSKAHTGIMSAEQLEAFKNNIQHNYGHFEVSEDILAKWREIGHRHHAIYTDWVERNCDVLQNVEQATLSAVLKTIREIKKEFFVSRPFSSTRAISGMIIERMCKSSKYLISGSCDLGKSVCCLMDGMRPISASDYSGNYINYGIREHAMGAILNGITLHGGLKAFGGTFFSFSDYMRPAIRLSALMNIPSIFIFTHDSIGVGEDGPTHQPVEQLAGLRAIPGLNVFRPGDPLETLECWQTIFETKSPSVLVLSRQEVKTVRYCGKDNLCSKGAYMLYEDTTTSHKHVLILSTGSELGLSFEVRNILAKNYDIAVDLVSMPCWRLFELESDEYKNMILNRNVLKIAIEAGCDFGWHKYIGKDGLFFGVNSFGKSCSCLDNFNYFGLNSELMVRAILSKLLECPHEGCDKWVWANRKVGS